MKVFRIAQGRHKKLMLLVFALLVIIGGYFAYKYAYIYVERRKYTQAEVAIRRVASDLEAQGLITEFSKGCSKDQGKNNTGSIFCAISIFYNGDQQKDSIKNTSIIYNNALKNNDFNINAGYAKSLSIDPLPTGMALFNLPGSNALQCQLNYNSNWESDGTYSIGFSCYHNERFKLF